MPGNDMLTIFRSNFTAATRIQTAVVVLLSRTPRARWQQIVVKLSRVAAAKHVSVNHVGHLPGRV